MTREKDPCGSGRVERKVGEVIYDLLGGSQFRAMVGVRSAVAGPRSLSVKFPARSGPNVVRVKVDPSGERLDVEFLRVTKKGQDVQVVSTWPMLPPDRLRDLFERETGLSTRL